MANPYLLQGVAKSPLFYEATLITQLQPDTCHHSATPDPPYSALYIIYLLRSLFTVCLPLQRSLFCSLMHTTLLELCLAHSSHLLSKYFCNITKFHFDPFPDILKYNLSLPPLSKLPHGSI